MDSYDPKDDFVRRNITLTKYINERLKKEGNASALINNLLSGHYDRVDNGLPHAAPTFADGEVPPSPKNTIGLNPPVITTLETPPNSVKVDVNDLLKPTGISGAQYDSYDKPGIDLEKPCCKNEMKPCQHWNWDSASGEGYINSLSGRFWEVE